MVRSNNLQPNQVAFRVPPSCNKFDIHSYLTNIYGVNIQEVRTMNYAATYKRGPRGGKIVAQSAYKKAVVTLDEKFVWPEEPEWYKLDKEEHELGYKAAKRKVKGWRVRPREEEREKIKEISSQQLAKREEKAKK
ncbi:hypothetical protein G6F57_007361 [Rhizopus arrhizus]|uniref:Large ribosomal subunit protein uL23m n=1 Tax=Rhizopus oryzae TaxID=64495 RepID=A0A9P7BU15_RHIOR|nr:hypothetical protein G6F23_005446 [Rhizopus arrhizus]KAG1422718.1 hypothetical protein G6F58_003142 [Rhizopus delemar]KAG0765555.1 hypothetical protein G6F24_004329 [Rhizopus arrhizus]KAG0791721.1 hypothetical protein G6F22_006065 [Rhizopus arrhizus]KAG0792306.1 hypothetical protein G6F21_004452 [Rhizopus arrhizus]